MDSENKVENDEDENVNEEGEDLRNIPSASEASGLVSDKIADSSEIFKSKRRFPESSHFDSIIVEENGHAAKRMKLEDAEPLESGVGGAPGLAAAERSLPEAGAVAEGTAREALLSVCTEGGTPFPNTLSPPGDCSTRDAVSLKTDAENKVSLDSDREPPVPLREVSVGCIVGTLDRVPKCSGCDCSFSSLSDLEKHADCPGAPSKEQACCQCSHKAEGSSALHPQARHTHGPHRVFACDLCGFQCVEESLLSAHYLGKTHLRRQNLAARGGFVQILTKQPFPKKTCTMGTKSVRAKARTSKAVAKQSDSEGMRNVGSQLEDVRGSVSEQSGGNSELLVEMTPSRNTLSDQVQIVEEDVSSLDMARNPESQSKKLGALAASEGLIGKLESTRNTQQTAHNVAMVSRLRTDRSVLMLGNNFRRRGGTFALKAQARKRFNFLGINRRGANEAQRMYLKHFRTQTRANDTESVLNNVDITSSVQNPRATTPAPQEGTQDKSAPLLDPVQPDSLTVRPASDCPVTACIDCGHLASNRTDLEIHVQECHAREMKYCCQAWDSPSVSRRDLDGHLHESQRQKAASVLRCQCCAFASPTDSGLREHMRGRHSASPLCAPCKLFSSEKDVQEHRATETHRSSLVQRKVSQSFNNDADLQTLPVNTSDSENADSCVNESGKAAQEEPVTSRTSLGNEVRHLSKPQFQCKKCFYKTRSSTVLTRHIKLRHGQDYHFLCKACNLYSLSKEGMEKHIKRSKHLENAKKNNIGLSFEECIERVCIGVNEKELSVSGSGRPEGHAGTQCQEQPCAEKGTLTPKELSQSGVSTKEDGFTLSPTPKRGRPKGSVSRTCPHCGLLASSITNLTVHIRRKHSHQYSYLCKVCKYYTVTKGDMERHCATKKHKGRVEVEASGKQSSDIIVGPEGGRVEPCRKNASAAGLTAAEHAGKLTESEASVSEKPGDPGCAHQAQADGEVQSLEGEVTDKKRQVSLEPGEPLQQGPVTGASENKCLHCEFSAHSWASLELHVKRKHTKEFEFYCMACDYYAVTRREMTRHAATEKHKMKRQCYLGSSRVEADSTDMSRNVTSPEEEPQQNPEGFQVISHQPSETLKSRGCDGGPAVGENTDLAVSQVLSAPHAVGLESEEEAAFSEDHSFCLTFQPPPDKGKGIKTEEMVSLNVSSKDDSPSRFQSENSGSCALNCEAVKKNPEVLNDSFADVHCEQAGGSRGDGGSQVLPRHLCPGAQAGEHPAGSPAPAVVRVAREQLMLGGSGPNTVGCAHSLEGLKGVQENSVLKNKEILINSQHETELVLEEAPASSEGTVESSDVYETVISIDEKGQAVYRCSRFDSSIVRIKNPEDGELLEQSEEALVTAGGRASELPLKDGAQGLKRKKPEGTPFGESTRIRCDDCGFLADGLSGLNVHIAMKHPSKEKHFHCLLCGKSFYTESNLHQHLASAGHMRNEQASVEELPEGGATFKCVKCTEPFDSEQNLFLHIKGQHEELLREVNKYIVEDTEQINREREENQGNVCKYCGKMCRSSNSMAFLAHIRTHTGSKPFKCKICHFATAQLGDARNHVKRHLGMREYKCHICGVAFVMKKHLNTHLLGKHGVGTPKERKFTCHLCDRSFTEKWALNNHMKLHTGEKPFKCSWPTCHYSFLTASAMKDHYRTHTGEKSFLCDLCGFAGGTRHALTKHRRQHTGEKPFKCDECNFASTTQSHLTRHKRVHTGEKPYRCPWCDYRSNCAENIRKHILHTGKHEGVKMYNCPKCDYGTNVPVEFRNHLKEQHPDIENPDLAYLHAGIVSKSYECRLKGQGATFVETDSPFTAAALAEESAVKEKALRGRRQAPPPEQVQQLIIIQGYDGDFALDASVEETAAATLQTLAMAGQVARVVHITEDGQVIATSQNGAHVGGVVPGPVLSEPLADGAAQVVVVGGSVEGRGVDEALSPGGAVVQQVAKPEVFSLSEAGPPDAASALDALLCAVTELGEAEGRAGSEEERGQAGRGDVLIQLPCEEAAHTGAVEPEAPDVQESPAAMQVLTHVVRPSAIVASPERAQMAFKKVVHGVLQFAVCDSAAAGQLIKDGVTQVLVNEEGAVHMVAGEGSQILMQEAEAPSLRVQGEHVDLVESHGDISQIIVTEELVQAMVRESSGSFPEGATHYIVTELPTGAQGADVFSHTVVETAGSADLLRPGAALAAETVAPGGAEQLTSVVIYTQDASPAATVIQSQRENNELQEA
ncbi:zinc finger protein 407 [Ochotona princeps]|uniref:zinc finger protein 407 n=1 Tax=Ochotona princeps TaxID=9978 RepID=UPI00271472FF|nr:zinc finger protein 407 [Ochotona princeps]